MRTQEENIKLANILFPHRDKNNINNTLENITEIKDRNYYENFYLSKKRELKSPNGHIMRAAPSPTGELHTGALYTFLLNRVLASKSEGCYILRIEDTDQKREVIGATDKFVKFLNKYKIDSDEGFVFDSTNNQTIERGDFGPYLQSKRQDIYEAFVYDLIVKGYAYPCFMSEADLILLREEQEVMKKRTGVYGSYAKHKDLSFVEIEDRIIKGQDWIIRLDSKGDFNKKIKVIDEFMGELDLSENDENYVIYKSDKLPTYHLAHLVDDYLMGVTFVIRANEWVPSITKHLEMWNILKETRSVDIDQKFGSIKIPKYGHLMPINTKDGDSVRKLSKRKDKEAILVYFDILGYPKEAVIAYLFRLMAPTFDDWWAKGNRDVYNYDLNTDELKRNSRGPLLDLVKLNSFSSDIFGEMSAEEIVEFALSWSKEYDIELYNIISNKDNKYSKSYFKDIMNIERGGAKPRKDLRHMSELKSNIFYFYEELFNHEDINSFVDLKDYNEFKINLETDLARKSRLSFMKTELSKIENSDLFFDNTKSALSLDDWITKMKSISMICEYEKFGEFMMDMRLAISKKKNTPNMYYLFQVLKCQTILDRL